MKIAAVKKTKQLLKSWKKPTFIFLNVGNITIQFFSWAMSNVLKDILFFLSFTNFFLIMWFHSKEIRNQPKTLFFFRNVCNRKLLSVLMVLCVSFFFLLTFILISNSNLPNENVDLVEEPKMIFYFLEFVGITLCMFFVFLLTLFFIFHEFLHPLSIFFSLEVVSKIAFWWKRKKIMKISVWY